MTINIHSETLASFLRATEDFGSNIRYRDPAGNYSEWWLLDGNDNGPDYIWDDRYGAIADLPRDGWVNVSSVAIRDILELMTEMVDIIVDLDKEEVAAKEEE